MSENTDLQSATANASTSGGGLATLAQSVLQHISQTQGDHTNEVVNNNQGETFSVSNAEDYSLKRSRDPSTYENTVASGSADPSVPTSSVNSTGNYDQSQIRKAHVAGTVGNRASHVHEPTVSVKADSNSGSEEVSRGKRARKPSKRAMEALDDTNIFMDDEDGIGVSFGQGVIGSYYQEDEGTGDSDLEGSGVRRRRVGNIANRVRNTAGLYGDVHAPPGSDPFDVSGIGSSGNMLQGDASLLTQQLLDPSNSKNVGSFSNLLNQSGSVGSNSLMSGPGALSPSALSALTMGFPGVPSSMGSSSVSNANLANLFNPRTQKVRSGRPRASHPTPATSFVNALSSALMSSGSNPPSSNLISSLLNTSGSSSMSNQNSSAALTSLLLGLPSTGPGSSNDASSSLASLLGTQSGSGSNPLASLIAPGPDGKPGSGLNLPDGQGANDPLMLATLAALNPSGAPPAGSAEGNQNFSGDGSTQKGEGGAEAGEGDDAEKKEGEAGDDKEEGDANKAADDANAASSEALLQQILGVGNVGESGSLSGGDLNNPNVTQGINLLSLLLPGNAGSQPGSDPNSLNPLISMLGASGGPLGLPGMSSGPPITVGRRKGNYGGSGSSYGSMLNMLSSTPGFQNNIFPSSYGHNRNVHSTHSSSRTISMNCSLCGITHTNWSEGESHMREAHPVEYEQALSWRRVTQVQNPDGTRIINHGDGSTTTINPDGSSTSTSTDPTLHERITFSSLGYPTNLPMRCRHCGKSWEGRPEALIVHEQAHFSTFTCPHNHASGCTFTAGSKGALDRHLAKTHGEGQPLPAYPCTKDPNCTYVATRLDTLRRHEATHIAPEQRQRFMCDVLGCGRSFANQGHLSRHRKKHDGVQFACERLGCYATFAQAADLKMHVDSVHLGLRWPCPAPGCGHLATQRGSLLRHVSRRHPGIQEEPWWKDTWKALKQVQGVMTSSNPIPTVNPRASVDSIGSAFPHSLVGLLNPGTEDMNASGIAAALQSITAGLSGQNQGSLGSLNVMSSVDGSQNLNMQQMLSNMQAPSQMSSMVPTNEQQYAHNEDGSMHSMGGMEQKPESISQDEAHNPIVSM